MHVRVLDRSERLDVLVVAITREDIKRTHRHAIERDLGVRDLGHEHRATRRDRHARRVRRDAHHAQPVVADGRAHEQRRRQRPDGRPLLVPGDEVALAGRDERRLDRLWMIAAGLRDAERGDALEARHERA